MPISNYKAIFKLFEKEKIDFQEFINDDDTKKMIGENYDFYSELWKQHYQIYKKERKKTEIKGRWNWLAFWFIPAWWGYRKMHGYFWGFAILIGGLIFFESYVDKTFVKSLSGMYSVLALYSRSSYLLHLFNLRKKLKHYQMLNAENNFTRGIPV